MFSSDLAPSRGQYETIARLSCTVLGVPAPSNRLEATVMIARLTLTADKMPEGVPVVEISEV